MQLEDIDTQAINRVISACAQASPGGSVTVAVSDLSQLILLCMATMQAQSDAVDTAKGALDIADRSIRKLTD